MRIYIMEDDLSVIGVLEDIVEGNGLGTICGDTGDGPPDLPHIIALAPDLILIDLLMPGKDGIQVVRELREMSPVWQHMLEHIEDPYQSAEK